MYGTECSNVEPPPRVSYCSHTEVILDLNMENIREIYTAPCFSQTSLIICEIYAERKEKQSSREIYAANWEALFRGTSVHLVFTFKF